MNTLRNEHATRLQHKATAKIAATMYIQALGKKPLCISCCSAEYSTSDEQLGECRRPGRQVQDSSNVFCAHDEDDDGQAI